MESHSRYPGYDTLGCSANSRFYIKLYLKAIISKFIPSYNVKKLSHDLRNAFSLVDELIVKQGYDMPEKARLLINEFAEFDKNSFLFRYGEEFQPVYYR